MLTFDCDITSGGGGMGLSLWLNFCVDLCNSSLKSVAYCFSFAKY